MKNPAVCQVRGVGLTGLFAALLILAGCSAQPTVFNQEIAGAPSIDSVAEAPTQYRGDRVRWGGTLIAVRNQKESSWLEVLSVPLAGSGKPKSDQEPGKRFFAKVEGFIDPEIYEVGRFVTVVGELDGQVNQKIGDFDYPYPVVSVAIEEQKLWPKPRKRDHIHVAHAYWPWAWPYYGFPYTHRYGFGGRLVIHGHEQTDGDKPSDKQ